MFNTSNHDSRQIGFIIIGLAGVAALVIMSLLVKEIWSSSGTGPSAQADSTTTLPQESRPLTENLQSGATEVPPDRKQEASLDFGWKFIDRKPPIQGLLALNAIAVDRPITFAEAELLGDKILEHYPHGVKFAIYFDEEFGKRHVANGDHYYANLFFHSEWDERVVGVEKSAPVERLHGWLNDGFRSGGSVWDATYEDGSLRCSTTGIDQVFDGESAKPVRSVPEIWWALVLNLFEGGRDGLLAYFYDLTDIEVKIYDRPGGRVIGIFTASRGVIEDATLIDLYPEGVRIGLQDIEFEIEDQFNAGALTSKQRDDAYHEWAKLKMSYFQKWFTELARRGARLEVIDTISREVPRGFMPH